MGWRGASSRPKTRSKANAMTKTSAVAKTITLLALFIRSASILLTGYSGPKRKTTPNDMRKLCAVLSEANIGT